MVEQEGMLLQAMLKFLLAGLVEAAGDFTLVAVVVATVEGGAVIGVRWGEAGGVDHMMSTAWTARPLCRARGMRPSLESSQPPSRRE